MSNSTPKVSIIMSVYNGSDRLQKSVESILNQTFTDWEFIIIDDKSEDNTWEILDKYAKEDRRIKMFQNKENIGLTKSLNRVLNLAQGEYIARQDADDKSFPERLEKQVAYLQSHPSVALVSTGVRYVDDRDKELWIDIPPTDPIILRWEFLFRNPLRHPTVMWRHELVNSQVGNYDPTFVCTQDYDLWVRIAENLTIATLPLILVEMCWHGKSISSTKAKAQDSLGTKIIYRQIGRYFPNEKLEEKDIASLRLMPRRKDSLQIQYLNNLNLSSFQQAADRYLRLWKQFCLTNDLKENSPTWQTLQQEVEQNIIELLGHCKQKQWFFLGSKLLGKYLLYFPSRTLALLLIILRKLIPIKLL